MRWLWGFAVVAVLLLPGSAAVAAGSLTAAPAQIAVDEDGRGTVVLVNSTAVERTLDLSVSDGAGGSVPGAKAHGPATIKAGGSVRLTVTLPPAAGAELVVVSRGAPDGPAEILRVPVRTRAVDAWTLRRSAPVRGAEQWRDLPLAGPCGTLGVRNGAPIGVVQSGGESVTITARCSSPEARSVRLDAGSTPWAARTYTGKVTVGAGATASPLDLTLVTTTDWWLVGLLILVGIAVALYVAHWTSAGRTVADLGRRTWAVEELVAPADQHNADAEFQKAALDLDLPPNVRTWTIRAAVTGETGRLRAGLRTERGAEARQQAGAALDVLEKRARTWPQVANVLGELRQCGDRIAVLTTYVERIGARTLQRPGGPELSLADLEDIESAAREGVALASRWPAGAIHEAEERSLGLPVGHDARDQLDSVLARFAAAADQDAATAALPAFWDADTEIRKAHVKAAGRPDEAGLAPRAGGFPGSGVFTPVEVDDPGKAARRLEVWISVVDQLIVAVLLVVAVLAGMQALYVGKTFGGWWDVAAALAWGLGAGAVAGPLAAALAQAGASFRAAAPD